MSAVPNVRRRFFKSEAATNVFRFFISERLKGFIEQNA